MPLDTFNNGETLEVVRGKLNATITKVNELDSTPPGSAAWGSIGGTLSNQTDLNSALSLKLNTADAFSESYNDLTDKPVLFDGVYSSLTGIPSTFTPSTHNQDWSTITNTPTTLAGYGITDGGGSPTWGSIGGTLSNQTDLQDALNLKLNTADAFSESYNDLTDKPVLFDGVYSSLSGIPSTFTPSAHNQDFSTITSLPTTLAGYGITDAQPLDGDLTAIADLSTSSYGRGLLTLADEAALRTNLSVETTAQLNARDTNNRSRANHTGTQTASTISDFASVASASAPVQSVASKTGAVTLVKGDVGLGNVDNTSDTSKPISTATQTALNAKLEAAAIANFETTTQLNARDTANRARANHTGAQAISTVTGLQAILDRILPVVGTAIKLPYAVTLTSGLWTSPAGLIYYAPNGNTIGSASSGAVVANPIIEALYLALWGNGWSVLNSAGGTTSRGANAAADWAANKRLVVPDYRGRVDVMAGQGSGLTDRVVGTQGGAETHALNANENASHGHGVNDPGHQHSTTVSRSQSGPSFTVPYVPGDGAFVGNQTYNGNPSFTGISIQLQGSGTPHNNMQPWAAMAQLWFVGVTT